MAVLRTSMLMLGALSVVGCTLLVKPISDSRDASSVDADSVDSGADDAEEEGADATRNDVDVDPMTDVELDALDEPEVDVDDANCPMNSGAYCLCDRPWTGLCDDGSFCLTVMNLGDPGPVGFCAPSCDCLTYDAPCLDSPFPAEPLCILVSNWPVTGEEICSCVLKGCLGDNDCPSGQSCQQIVGNHGPYQGEEVMICSPRKL